MFPIRTSSNNNHYNIHRSLVNVLEVLGENIEQLGSKTGQDLLESLKVRLVC